MGMYNDYYKKYYATIERGNTYKGYVPKGENVSVAKSSNEKIGGFPIFLNVFGKGYSNILIIQCVIALILTVGLLLYRMYPTTEIGKIYEYGLNYINKEVSMENITKGSVISVFNQFKGALNFNGKKEIYINENYIYPVQGEGAYNYSIDEDKLVINAKEDTVVRASYPGKVKNIDKDGNITINYGEGIEFTYSGIGEVYMSEGAVIDTNEVIGKSTSNSSNGISIEIFYMGDKLDPSKCFDLGKTV